MGYFLSAAGNYPAETAPLDSGEVGARYRRTSIVFHNVNKNPKTAMSALSGIPAEAKEEERREIVWGNPCFIIYVNRFYITLKQKQGVRWHTLFQAKSIIALRLMKYLYLKAMSSQNLMYLRAIGQKSPDFGSGQPTEDWNGIFPD